MSRATLDERGDPRVELMADTIKVRSGAEVQIRLLRVGAPMGTFLQYEAQMGTPGGRDLVATIRIPRDYPIEYAEIKERLLKQLAVAGMREID